MRPILAHLPPPVADLLPLVLPGWTGATGPVSGRPDVRAEATPGGFRVEAATLPDGRLDVASPIAAAGTVGGALTAAYVGQTDAWIELHAAAFLRSGRAVVMLGGTGAGKSSLALHLARRGHGLLSDDRVGVGVGAAGVVDCTALGVAVKARLPLPPDLDAAHRGYIGRCTRATYPDVAFLSLPSGAMAPLGGTYPLGALLLLQRQAAAAAAPSLRPANVADVVRNIVEHGLAPSLTAAGLVRQAERLARTLPAHWLHYADGGAAAAWLPDAVDPLLPA